MAATVEYTTQNNSLFYRLQDVEVDAELLAVMEKAEQAYIAHRSTVLSADEIIGSPTSVERLKAMQRLWSSLEVHRVTPTPDVTIKLPPPYAGYSDTKLVANFISEPNPDLKAEAIRRMEEDPTFGVNFLREYLPPVAESDHELVEIALNSLVKVDDPRSLVRLGHAMISAKIAGKTPEMLLVLHKLFPSQDENSIKSYVTKFPVDTWTLLYKTIYLVDGARSDDPQFGEKEFLKNPKGLLVLRALEILTEDYLK